MTKQQRLKAHYMRIVRDMAIETFESNDRQPFAPQLFSARYPGVPWRALFTQCKQVPVYSVEHKMEHHRLAPKGVTCVAGLPYYPSRSNLLKRLDILVDYFCCHPGADWTRQSVNDHIDKMQRCWGWSDEQITWLVAHRIRKWEAEHERYVADRS